MGSAFSHRLAVMKTALSQVDRSGAARRADGAGALPGRVGVVFEAAQGDRKADCGKQVFVDRQMAEQTRLLLQLKSKRALWPAQFETDETGEAAARSAGGAPTVEEKPNLDGSSQAGDSKISEAPVPAAAPPKGCSGGFTPPSDTGNTENVAG